MSDEIITTEETTTEIAKPDVAPVAAAPSHSNSNSNDREFRKNRRPTRRPNAPRSEFEQKMLSIRRVTRVSSGGRRFSFSVVMAIGNGKGKVGIGIGKAGDTSLAIDKAIKSAKKNMVDIKTTKDMSIPHIVEAKYSSAVVSLQPSAGKGIVAGSAVRDLIELGGLKDIVGKVRSGSKNKLNIAHATLVAFKKLSDPKY
ncbi:MAG: 30S ribosomal protein S5 [Candidatus Paceibacterota bacterium]